jgi:hypothetical protein
MSIVIATGGTGHRAKRRFRATREGPSGVGGKANEKSQTCPERLGGHGDWPTLARCLETAKVARQWRIERSDNGMHACKAWASVAAGFESHKQRAATCGNAPAHEAGMQGENQRRVSTASA